MLINGERLSPPASINLGLPVLPPDLRPTNVTVRFSSELPGTTPNDLVIVGTNHNYWFGNEDAGLAIQLNESWSRGTLRLTSADPLALRGHS